MIKVLGPISNRVIRVSVWTNGMWWREGVAIWPRRKDGEDALDPVVRVDSERIDISTDDIIKLAIATATYLSPNYQKWIVRFGKPSRYSRAN